VRRRPLPSSTARAIHGVGLMGKQRTDLFTPYTTMSLAPRDFMSLCVISNLFRLTINAEATNEYLDTLFRLAPTDGTSSASYQINQLVGSRLPILLSAKSSSAFCRSPRMT
jgi:hypothetical protein